jgi:DnaJ-class molecular chaperone
MVFENKKNYYDVLELTPDCSQEEIHIAYNRAKNSYSDESAALYSLLSAKDCREILEQVEQAYSVIGDIEKRKEYNKVKGFAPVLANGNIEDFSKNEVDSDESLITNNLMEETLGHPQVSENPINTNSAKNVDKFLNKEKVKASSTLNDLMSPSIYRQDFSKQSEKSGFHYSGEHSNRHNVNVSKIQAHQKFQLQYEINQEFEQKIENCSHFTGDFLKSIREYKNMTIERLAELTKISKTYLRHIEDENIEKLPALVYTRGFVFQYAKTLKLNPELVATSYLKIYQEKRK